MNIEYAMNAEINPAELQELFKQTEWAMGRSAEGIGTMLKHTPLNLAATHDGKLVGFARVMTDTIYRALIEDVVVDSEYRSLGIGHQLITRLGAELSGVEEVLLGCDPKMVPYYEKRGYKLATNPHMKTIR